MTDDNESGANMARFGEVVLSHGFPILPIKPGEKRPANGSEWQRTAADVEMVRKWVGNGLAGAGIGILSRTTPGVDLDIMDAQGARHMEEWIGANIGAAPVRYGMRPKRLMMFRTEQPFRKLTSRKWITAEGRECKVEILCDGQQFVAFAVHPDTGENYEWRGDRGPHSIDRTELNELTEDGGRRIIAEFERYAEAAGWTVKTPSALAPLPGALADGDDWHTAIPSRPIGMDGDQMRRVLAVIPVFETYSEWLQVLAAICHEFQDDPKAALELSLFYSHRCRNFDAAEVEDKVASFHRHTESGAKTARFLLRLARKAQHIAAVEGRAEVEAAMRKASDLAALTATAERAKRLPMDLAARNVLAGLLRENFKRITGQALGVRDSRDMLRHEDPERRTMPAWMRPFVYLTDDCTFYSREDGATVSERSFNAAHARRMLTTRDLMEGRAHPEVRPADAALNLYQVPIVRNRMYKPDEDSIFTFNGVCYVNTYLDRSVPRVPDDPSRAELADVERVRKHLTHLFEVERDRELFLSWLAHIAQTRKRPNWAVVLQGTEGGGKSFFRVMMGAVLGDENVRSVDGAILQHPFNAWAADALLVALEEVRLVGHNRHDVLNHIKPLITNPTVMLHRKGKDPYEVPNTAAYLLLTNYSDALPLGDNDSRYLVLRSRWQTQRALARFREDHPSYYPKLYGAIQRSAGAIRGWLLRHEAHPEFDPADRAPASAGKAYMAEVTKNRDRQDIDAVLADSRRPDLSTTLLSTAALDERITDMRSLMVMPATSTLHQSLMNMGFTYLGRFEVDGQKSRYWSQEPERFIRDGRCDPQLIREYLKFGGL